jgi:SAM-dependent methyltransferase
LTGDRPMMFHRLAEQYDALVSGKDYPAEVRRLEAIVRRQRGSPARSWLDVGCGTGGHLSYLRRRYRVTGVDRSPEMLAIARRKLPGIDLLRGDMRRLDLGRRFDVVSCLFSAIGHLASEADLRASFGNFARHLTPGGVVIVEPWIDSADFRPGFVQMVTQRSARGSVARMSSSARRGRYSWIHYHYLTGDSHGTVEHFEEVDRGLLIARSRLLALLRASGLRARFEKEGLTPGRGLLIGWNRADDPPGATHR